jgi:hypothetical protein
MRATVVVFPVPGPPATTARRRSTAEAAASAWRPAGSSANNRAMPSASTLVSTPSAGFASPRRSAATWRSSRQ